MPTLLFCRAIPSIAALVLGWTLAFSAMAEDAGIRQLREQQHSLHELEQQQRLQRWQRYSRPGDAPQSAEHDTPDSHCWIITGVRLSGNRRLSDAALEEVVLKQLRPCMGANAINQLLRAITQRYVKAGYPTARPALTSQPHDDAPLDIVINEGFIESIEFADPSLPLSLRGAFPDLLGAPLHLPDLEQGLDQLNRLRAFDLYADLLPGKLEGGTQVRVQTGSKGSRWHAEGRLDNRGSDSNGRYRMSLALGIDSPFGLNDDLRLEALGTVFHAPGETHGLKLYYSVPYGPWSFVLNAGLVRYRTPLPGMLPLVSAGSVSLLGASAERVLWREQRGMLSAGVRLNQQSLKSTLGNALIGNALIGLQSPQLLTTDAGFNLLWVNRGLWNVSAGIVHGRSIASDPRRETLTRQFLKYRAGLSYLSRPSSSMPLHWQTELALQYSPNLLPAIEQIALTDESAVRGFRQQSVASASGAVWRNTLNSPFLPLPAWPALQLNPYAGLDLGWSRRSRDPRKPEAPNEPDSRRLAGATLGIAVSLPRSNIRLEYQRPLYASDLNRYRDLPLKGFWLLEWRMSL